MKIKIECQIHNELDDEGLFHGIQVTVEVEADDKGYFEPIEVVVALERKFHEGTRYEIDENQIRTNEGYFEPPIWYHRYNGGDGVIVRSSTGRGHLDVILLSW